MPNFPYDAEARDSKLQQLIDARIAATENDILAGRSAILRAVAEKAGEQQGERSLNCDQDEAEALVRAAVLGKSALVGARIAEVVSYAIYAYALPLAGLDLVDMERNRAESVADSRVERGTWLRAFA